MKKQGRGFSLALLIIIGIIILCGFIHLEGEGKYNSFSGSLLVFNGDLNIGAIIGAIIAVVSAFINFVLFSLNRNQFTLSIILCITYVIGLAILCISYLTIYMGEILSIVSTYSRWVGKDFILFPFIFCGIALIADILSVVTFSHDRTIMDEYSKDDNPVSGIVSFKKLGYFALIILALGILFGGAAIPFSATTTQQNSFVDYNPSEGFVERVYYSTKYLFSGNAYGSLAILAIIAFVVYSFIFLIKASKEYEPDDEITKYRNITVILAIAGNFLEFIAVGGWSIIFGAGFFIAVSGYFMYLAVKIQQSYQYD